jgi:DUF4097 and DUF4098 domain-containing protein YvlB
VDIVSGPAGDVRLEALKIVRGDREDRSRRLADETLVEAGREGDRLVVRVRYPRNQSYRFSFWEIFGGIEIPGVEVRLTLTVPAGVPVSASSTSGDLRTQGITAVQSLETTSGDVEVENAGGLVQASSTSGDVSIAGASRAVVRTTSGDVSIAGCSGRLQASTVSGSLRVSDAGDSVVVESVSGDLTVRGAPRGLAASTTSGDLVARGVSGRVRASSASGDVEIHFAPLVSGVDITTTSGTLDVWLPEGLRCAVEMKTSSGEINVRVPLELETVSRHRVTGTVGGGGVPVLLRSSSGDIGVMSGGS